MRKTLNGILLLYHLFHSLVILQFNLKINQSLYKFMFRIIEMGSILVFKHEIMAYYSYSSTFKHLQLSIYKE